MTGRQEQGPAKRGDRASNGGNYDDGESYVDPSVDPSVPSGEEEDEDLVEDE